MDLEQQIAAENMASNYRKTLALLACLKDGSVRLDEVDLVEGGWSLTRRPPPGSIEVTLDETGCVVERPARACEMVIPEEQAKLAN